MGLLRNTLWAAMIITSGSAQAASECAEYWAARKSGRDWEARIPLGAYDQTCASNLVIAKDWNGLCGVHVTFSRRSVVRGETVTGVGISWFKCDVGGTELSFGDFVDGTTEERCQTTCDGCATGPTVTCGRIFIPASQ